MLPGKINVVVDFVNNISWISLSFWEAQRDAISQIANNSCYHKLDSYCNSYCNCMSHGTGFLIKLTPEDIVSVIHMDSWLQRRCVKEFSKSNVNFGERENKGRRKIFFL